MTADHDELNQRIRRAAGRLPPEPPTEATEEAEPGTPIPPVPSGARGTGDLDGPSPAEVMNALIADQLDHRP